jgi:hypothetical protein
VSRGAGRPHPEAGAFDPTAPIEAHRTIPADEHERLLADETPDRSQEIAALRAQIAALTADDPNWGHARGAFQFMTGDWSQFAPGERRERSELTAEAIRRSRSHLVKEGSAPVRIAHASDPMIGCAWCIASDRGEEAIAALRSISGDERYQLPHLALYVLAVDDLRRERS